MPSNLFDCLPYACCGHLVLVIKSVCVCISCLQAAAEVDAVDVA
jgi:hypothetical protein